MKSIEITMLEMVNHLAVEHKNLAPRIEQIALAAQGKKRQDVDLILNLSADLLQKSKSQLRQDLFVLFELNFKRCGYFVDFGATNGVDINNSWLLEKEFSWNGILAEAARCWHKDLNNNRDVHIEESCVWSASDLSLTFSEVNSDAVPTFAAPPAYNAAELSTVAFLCDSDSHSKTRKNCSTYEVNTISLNDLLEKYNAPQQIDYLSIDTEGSEYEILSAFDFNKYHIKIITCEHNYTPNRERIYQLLTSKGYTRKFEQLSQFDDWYTKTTS